MQDPLKLTWTDALFVLAAIVGIVGGFLHSTAIGLIVLAVVGVTASVVLHRYQAIRRARRRRPRAVVRRPPPGY